jgi:D-alanyl-D-alanine carboxypeptidase
LVLFRGSAFLMTKDDQRDNNEKTMKSFRLHILVIVVALVAGIAVVAFAARSGRGQSPSRKSESPVKPAVLMTNRVGSARTSASSAFVAPAARNASLKNELAWTFGGKQQRGWYLYELLLRKTLNTDTDSTSADFANALASWQRQKGLSPNGVLDEDSFMGMVSQWQGNRLKNRTYAQPDQLVLAPSSDFYDPERLPELRQVERNAYAAYKKMVAAAMADPKLNLAHSTTSDLAPGEKYFKIISSFRSREYQDQLRRKSPNAGSAGLAVNSPHFTGRALDIYVGGDPVDTRDSNRAIQVNTPAYQWLVRNAERFGFRPYFYEPWHWEYVG